MEKEAPVKCLNVLADCNHGRSQGKKGSMPRKFQAYLVILCFERRCLKSNAVARLKSRDLVPQTLRAGYAIDYNELT